jgi:hypothetical protein
LSERNDIHPATATITGRYRGDPAWAPRATVVASLAPSKIEKSSTTSERRSHPKRRKVPGSNKQNWEKYGMETAICTPVCIRSNQLKATAPAPYRNGNNVDLKCCLRSIYHSEAKQAELQDAAATLGNVPNVSARRSISRVRGTESARSPSSRIIVERR